MEAGRLIRGERQLWAFTNSEVLIVEMMRIDQIKHAV